MPEAAGARYERYRRALASEPLPCALVDLDAVDENVDRLLVPVRARQRRLRLATKSIRCPALIRHVMARGAGTIAGLMTYCATESAWLAGEGFADLLLAYPTVQAADLGLLAEINRRTRCAVVVDDVEQLAPLAAAAVAAGTLVPAVIEVDLSYRPLGGALHLGVRRSPLRTVEAVLALADQIAARPGLRFFGLLGYEAQIAGLPDRSPFRRWQNGPKRLLKRLSRPRVVATRAALAHALAARGTPAELFNGGGTGSLGWCSDEDALTEVTAGSGFLGSVLFDHYRDLKLEPALYFALQVVRRPAPDLVTCHGGGIIASGEPGPDRLPRPSLPAGLQLLSREGAGEVQTPLTVPKGVELRLGDPVFFRPAKAGELAEHFGEYLLLRGDSVIARAPTYRGLGRAFLG